MLKFGSLLRPRLVTKYIRSLVKISCARPIHITPMTQSNTNAQLDPFNVIFILGGPGAGKGTQCAKIVEEFGYVHLSAGELLRQEMNTPGSKVGEEIAQHMTAGTIVAVEITCSLLEKEMIRSGKQDFLIDGFPRNEDNLSGWVRQMNDKTRLRAVVCLECPAEVCIQRCVERGKTCNRIDDNIETLKRRLVQFENQCRPIIEHYNKQNLVCEIEATGTPNEVFDRVKKALEDLNVLPRTSS